MFRLLFLAFLLVGVVSCGGGTPPEVKILPLVWQEDGGGLYHHKIQEGTIYYLQGYSNTTMCFVPKDK